MKDATGVFTRVRPRLHGIAYRMLSSSAEAEDVVQDTWLRWHEADHDALDNPEAWLVTVTTRLSIDRLRSAKTQREHYEGIWLPEPLLADSPPSPEQLAERSDDISVAFLIVLERLGPEARAAFLLREVFDAGYDEVAQALGKSEAACRQIVHRAKEQLHDATPRYKVPEQAQHALLQGFVTAAQTGDFWGLNAMLAEHAELMGDGGGKVTSFPKPLQGGKRIAQLFYAAHRRFRDAVRMELAVLNGEWALLRFIEGGLESAQAYETDGKHITRIFVQRNPDKLARIAATVGAR